MPSPPSRAPWAGLPRWSVTSRPPPEWPPADIHGFGINPLIVIATGTLLCFGADEGAGALGLEQWDDVEVALTHQSLRGVEDVFEGLIAGCAADVFV